MERPKFTPKHLAADGVLDDPPLCGRNAQPWIPIITCPANFPIELVSKQQFHSRSLQPSDMYMLYGSLR